MKPRAELSQMVPSRCYWKRGLFDEYYGNSSKIWMVQFQVTEKSFTNRLEDERLRTNIS